MKDPNTIQSLLEMAEESFKKWESLNDTHLIADPQKRRLVIEQLKQTLTKVLKSYDKSLRVEDLKKDYDGNDLKSACDAHGVAADSWSEIIRFEQGYDLANLIREGRRKAFWVEE